MQALQRLLAVLLSSAGGLQLLLHNPVAMGALLKALDAEADPYGAIFPSETQPTRSVNPRHTCSCLPCHHHRLRSCQDHLLNSFLPLILCGKSEWLQLHPFRMQGHCQAPGHRTAGLSGSRPGSRHAGGRGRAALSARPVCRARPCGAAALGARPPGSRLRAVQLQRSPQPPLGPCQGMFIHSRSLRIPYFERIPTNLHAWFHAASSGMRCLNDVDEQYCGMAAYCKPGCLLDSNMQHATCLASVQDPLHPQPADADKPEQQWRAGSLYGAALLQALLSDDQPQSLQAWATAAPAVLDALNEAQAACSGSEGVR